jgi:hypothetical protein
MALALEDNGIRAVRVETDVYVAGLFPVYSKLKALEKFDEAHRLFSERWPFIQDVTSLIIRKSLAAGFTVLHDHVNIRPFRKGVDRAIAEESGARHLGVLVTAPLSDLKERWALSHIPEAKVRKMVASYSEFEELGREKRFGMVFDTSLSRVEDAAKRILSTMFRGIVVDVGRQVRVHFAEPDVSEEARPKLKEGVRVIRENDAYLLVYQHRRYMSDVTCARIVRLCDGSNTFAEMAQQAKTDMETVRGTVEVLHRSGMLRYPLMASPSRVGTRVR